MTHPLFSGPAAGLVDVTNVESAVGDAYAFVARHVSTFITDGSNESFPRTVPSVGGGRRATAKRRGATTK